MTTDHRTLQLDDIEARATAATPGPWKRSEDYSDVLAPDGSQLASYWLGWDGEFIAHAREDVPALIAEIRRLRTELDVARTAAFVEAEKKIADAIDWNRTEYPAVGGMITRRLGMRAAERVVRELREEAEGGCPGFEDNPVAPDACAGCHQPREAHATPTT